MSTAKKARRLKVKEMSDILSHLRTYLPKNCVPGVASLVWHINWLEHDRLMLERELREVKQADLFDKKPLTPTDYEYTQPAPPVRHFSTPGERMYALFEAGERAVEVYLRTHNLSPLGRAELLRTANEWAKMNKKELINE